MVRTDDRLTDDGQPTLVGIQVTSTTWHHCVVSSTAS
jgi:hypothetical protein